MTVQWSLSVQIYVPRGDTFTMGSSTMDGPDALGMPNFNIGDWVDLTCETGEIIHKYGFQNNDPLSQYEVGTCDILLKGLTYAPTLNEDVLPGVKIRVLASHPAYYSQFASQFENDFLATTYEAEQIPIFRGYILDAVEDRVANSVKIAAVDDWHKALQYKDTDNFSNYSGIDLINLDLWNDFEGYQETYTAWPVRCVTDPAVNYGDYFTTTHRFLGPINYPGAMEWDSSMTKTGTSSTTWTLLSAATPDLCVPGTATVDLAETTGGNGWAGIGNATNYWRIMVDITPTTGSCKLNYIEPYIYMSVVDPGNDLETTLAIQRSQLGSIWMTRDNVPYMGAINIWHWESQGPHDFWRSWGQRLIRISDIHTGDHLCYYDLEQQTSLSSVLNSLVVNNFELDVVPTTSTTTYEDAASVAQYGRRQEKIDIFWSTDLSGVYPGNQIINQTKLPESNVTRVSVELTPSNLHLLPNLHDTIQFEYNGTTQYRRVSRVDLQLLPGTWTADIEFFDYTPTDGLVL